MQLELNLNEAQVLLSLIDLAVKSAGLQAAEAGLHLAKKINAVMPAPAADPIVEAEPVN